MIKNIKLEFANQNSIGNVLKKQSIRFAHATPGTP